MVCEEHIYIFKNNGPLFQIAFGSYIFIPIIFVFCRIHICYVLYGQKKCKENQYPFTHVHNF